MAVLRHRDATGEDQIVGLAIIEPNLMRLGAPLTVYDVRGVMADPQYAAHGTALTVDGRDLGPLLMQNVLFRLWPSPGSVRWSGRGHGADSDEVYDELGLTADEIVQLREQGVG